MLNFCLVSIVHSGTVAQKIQNGFMYLVLERRCIQLFNIIVHVYMYFLAFEKNYIQQKTIKLLYLYMYM